MNSYQSPELGKNLFKNRLYCLTSSQMWLIPLLDLALNGNRTDKAIEFFCILALIWRPTGGGLLNLAKPAQYLYFYGHFFFKISRNLRKNIPLKNLFFAFWRNFGP
jgi:hypothetical protein